MLKVTGWQGWAGFIPTPYTASSIPLPALGPWGAHTSRPRHPAMGKPDRLLGIAGETPGSREPALATSLHDLLTSRPASVGTGGPILMS